jgi:hypothetical protein
MQHDPEGAPVLVSIEDIGPLYGRVFIDEVGDFEMFELAESTRWHRSWRVEVSRVPHRLVQPLLAKLNTTGLPVEVRVWGEISQGHYVGKAYGGFGGVYPRSAEPYQTITLHGQGSIDWGDWL